MTISILAQAPRRTKHMKN